jgi:hypothetical protein
MHSDFTAIAYSRTRPQFMETRSEPSLTSSISPSHGAASLSPGSIPPTTNCKRSPRDFRSVSSPLQGRSQSPTQDEQNVTETHPRKRRRSNHGAFSAPTASPSRSSTTPRSIHDKLCEELQKQLTPSDTTGVMYVLFDPRCKEAGYKIGWTIRAYAERIKEHNRDCGYTPEVVHVSGHAIKYCGRLERLVHIDLKHHCQPRHCDKHKDSTMKRHQEWFNITEDMAVQTVKRWEGLMRREQPYGWNRRLKPVWRHLLERKSPVSPNVRDFTHEARREQWTHILAPPTITDYLEAYSSASGRAVRSVFNAVSCTWMYLYTFFWQLSTILYSMATLVWFRNVVAFSAFAFFLACAAVAVLAHVKLHSPRRRPRTPTKIR